MDGAQQTDGSAGMSASADRQSALTRVRTAHMGEKTRQLQAELKEILYCERYRAASSLVYELFRASLDEN